jgi:hypothetical protein
MVRPNNSSTTVFQPRPFKRRMKLSCRLTRQPLTSVISGVSLSSSSVISLNLNCLSDAVKAMRSLVAEAKPSFSAPP